MDILGILILIVCIWLFFKVVGALFKVAIVIVAIAVIWYLAGAYLGVPTPF
jgi:hypothetical protein